MPRNTLYLSGARQVANGTVWPTLNSGSEYLARRVQSLAKQR